MNYPQVLQISHKHGCARADKQTDRHVLVSSTCGYQGLDFFSRLRISRVPTGFLKRMTDSYSAVCKLKCRLVRVKAFAERIFDACTSLLFKRKSELALA